ncbi:MAG: T9SS type A sorting domain-containing protein [Saprospiraceae bacterium]|nr:T9SS type A sorting domain-containing protein [Saprospiraceae bacterium]MCF8252597.1 T9SS type A sorting domain-containing protein [Saprospiraceae bacterium]MCF8282654.1 T9SS type A sorting domain-containing protein [Bacteroidales bacterium]MCF8314072.1 T9SS type A sorting domain-containing protein [Saprospiraceae bacterium]MCF8442944.1 T9SS type A sorting domain-containing protein [Saprospiraceae bacterium]
MKELSFQVKSNIVALVILLACLPIFSFAQSGCSGITFSFEHYEPCHFRLHVDNTSECYPFLRLLIDVGEYTSWEADTPNGWTGELVSPTEILLTNAIGFVPLGASTPVEFSLPPSINPTLTMLWDYDCPPGEGCLADFPLMSCTDPCEVSLVVTPQNNCGLVQVCANATGPAPYSYQWCSGESTQCITTQIPSCTPFEFCVSVTCSDGTVATATQNYTVVDITPPTAVCSGVGVDLEANCMATITPGLIDGGSTDNCQIQSMTVSPSVVTGCGLHPVTLTVTDWCGNISTCSTSVQTIEVIPPNIVCPPSKTVSCDANTGPNICGFATAIDNCDPNPVITHVDVVSGFMPCDGVIQRTWTAEDECGNVASCVQNITVFDNVPPSITNCSPNQTVTGTIGPNGQCTANVLVTSPSVTDNCDLTPTLTNSFNNTANASGTYPQGTTTVTWTGVDGCMNVATCSFTVTVECVSCPPSCITNTINISTGADPTNLGSYLLPGGADPMWTLIAAPASAGLTTPQPGQLIGAFGNAWDQPASTWLSAFPFNNYGVNNCQVPPQDCSCPPFTYQRCFCICEDGPVTFDFGFWSDNNGKVELWQETTPNSNNYTLFSTLADNCNNLNSVSNFNMPPAGQAFNNPPLSVNTTLTLTKGRYCIRIHNWNLSGVAMGVNLLGNVSGLNLETDQCCAPATGTICITKFHDLDCDTIRDFNTSNWTYIDPGLSNWTFNLVGPTSSYVGTTNAQGQVCFTGLPANVPYVISEVQQSGWSVSTPPNGTITVTPVPFTTTNIEFGNCTDECKCGPYEFWYSVGRGPLVPKYCGDVLYIPDGLPFQFNSSFSCIGVCNPPVPTVDYVLTGPPGFVTLSMNGIPATPGYSLPIIASTFTIAGTYTLTITGHCGNNLCEPCELTFIYPGDCCKDQELFCANLDNYISISVDNALCKATLNIGNLPECDTLEWVNWGDNTGNQTGPFTANSMVMHTYSQSGMFVISYLAIEKDPVTGLICFEKVVYDTIFLSCSDSDCPLNLVQNGDFSVGTPNGNHETIGLATKWSPIWSDGISTGDFYNQTLAPPPFQIPLPAGQGGFATIWVFDHPTDPTYREGVMNELSSTIPQSSCDYNLEFKLACLDNSGPNYPTIEVYGVFTTGFGTGSIISDPPNSGIFGSTPVTLLGSYQIPSSCNGTFNLINNLQFNASTLPTTGISHIFFTRADNQSGATFIAIDDVCLTKGFCPQDSCCQNFDAFCALVAQGFTVATDPILCKATVTAPQFDSCHWFTTPPHLQGANVPQVITATDGMWMFNFTQSGVYTICVDVYEENGDSICWQKEMCTTVDIACENACACGDFTGMNWRPTQGAPNQPITCGDELTLGCLPTGYMLNFGGQFDCIGNNCPPSVVNWELREIATNNLVTSGTTNGPGFQISIAASNFVFPKSYKLVFTGICDGVVCEMCMFTIFTTECPCYCGEFTDMFIRTNRGAPSQQVSCGGMPVTLNCPQPGQSFNLTGLFQCAGSDCPEKAPTNWTLTGPGGTFTGTTSANPYFGIIMLPTYFTQPGLYTLTINGQCGNQSCPCVIQFNVNCPNLCPCDVQALGNAVNQGFAVVKYPTSCKACFVPVALSDCETVEWHLNTANGPLIGTSVGNNAVCHTFPSSGTYTVVMIVTRLKPDGSICEVFTKSQTVTITCLIIADCTDSDFPNPTFIEGAVSGGMLSGGLSSGWVAGGGEPIVVEGSSGSFDAWTIQLSGNFDTSSVLTSLESICLEESIGTISVRAKAQSGDSGGRDRPCDIMVFNFEHYEPCKFRARIPLNIIDSSEWVEILIPFDLNYEECLDSCFGGNGVWIKPRVYVTNALGNIQGGEDTYSFSQLDNFCIDGTPATAVNDTRLAHSIHLFPNPTSGSLTLQFNGATPKAGQLQILDLYGRVVQMETLVPGQQEHTFTLAALPASVYFVKVLDDGLPIWTEKVIKQ